MGDTDKPEKPEDEKEEKKEDEKDEEKDKPEPKFENLSNPARVTLTQESSISFDDTAYAPVVKTTSGVVMLRFTGGDGTEEILQEMNAPSAAGVHGDEPKAPKPFRYTGP